MSFVSRRRLRQAAEMDPATDPATDPGTDPDITGPVPILSGLPPAPDPDWLSAPTDAGLLDVARDERAELVGTLLWLRERLTSVALVDRLDQSLRAVGVTRADVRGRIFDPSWQEAGLPAETSDPSRAGTVADVESEGWYDHGTLIRHPVVSVYRLVTR